MPARNDIKKILIIGSGPIVIGQACEFDYSGTQACKSLRQEGYQVVLVNSNPATIMTDPEMVERTYIEPITAETVEKIIQIEKPQAVLPTLGGQTGLNVAVELAKKGILDKYGVELIGAKLEAIEMAEDRILFKEAMGRVNIPMPESFPAYSVEEAVEFAEKIGYPAVIRPAYTLGGTGGGIAYNIDELRTITQRGLDASTINQVLVEESVIGWKEYELEVMRDLKDNVVIICSIENIDPMGVHTGDSITVAPAQTLSDKEYQVMREAAIKIIREIGVETGGSNVQFAVNPDDGRMVVIEMNPRVSRSSALASKATGFPIAKIAAKLAIGFTLDEIQNDITRETPASFEPTIDYVVVKYPRWAFEKFRQANQELTTQMKSVGEAMSIGRTFKESLQKAIRSMEIGMFGFSDDEKNIKNSDLESVKKKLLVPNSKRLFYLKQAFVLGMDIEEVYQLTKIDLWFLFQLKEILGFSDELSKYDLRSVPLDVFKEAKRLGFSDRSLAQIFGAGEEGVRKFRQDNSLFPVYKMVDTCAAEFEAVTPYYYSTYEEEDEVVLTDKKKVMILGSGPNRIGQGIEFDYVCVHASFAIREEGIDSIMVNSNPETVSTDYDTSDRLYFEPLTVEDVLNIYRKEKPLGVIVQFGGQTPLNLAKELEKNGVNILGTSINSIDLAEDREKFSAILEELSIKQPESGIARSCAEAVTIANKIGYPVLVRPSYVLGGRAMEIVYDEQSLNDYMEHAIEASPKRPILIDKFLEKATEVDVDAVCDGEDVYIGGIMEHVEEAGIHSGDSACVLPPYKIHKNIIKQIEEQTFNLAMKLKVVGLMNIQFAVLGRDLYVLEVNPRASRTVPFVSKATGVPLAKIATKILLGKKLCEFNLAKNLKRDYFSVKEAVFPFSKFPEVDPLLGPEMRATGEVMGIADSFGAAFYKSQDAAGSKMPIEGNVLISIADKDKEDVVEIAKRFKRLNFEIYSTKGTRLFLSSKGIESELAVKLYEGRPNIQDDILNGNLHLIINTHVGRLSKQDDSYIRKTAIQRKVPYVTTISAAAAAVEGIELALTGEMNVKSIQEYHAGN